MLLFPQLTTPNFPVVVKMGHAHAGMGKVREVSALFTFAEVTRYRIHLGSPSCALSPDICKLAQAGRGFVPRRNGASSLWMLGENKERLG